MKKLTFLLLLLLTITSCKDKKSESEMPMDTSTEQPKEVEKPKYPENLTKVFDAHGGLDTWKTMRTLEFSMENPDGNEITTTDLKERYSLVEMPKHTIGFDGENVWMKSKGGAKYEGNPKFYYNLMFYFYAMPFVLSDEGISYSDAQPLTVEGKTYPGIQISYESGVGASPDDQYVLYYDTDTNKMAWLGYTVTYFSKEKAKEWHFIKYSEWQNVEGLLLPETLTWYAVENNVPTTKKNDVKFSNISLTTDKMDLRMYMMPDGAEEIQ
ncbi:MAG: DUF6503 family protein [Aquaticitalea sp.]